MYVSRGKRACTNKSAIPQVALETKVKSVLDTVAKDPQQLATLVREHNDRVDQHNHEHHAEAQRLEARLRETRTALDRLVTAIEAGTASATVMAAIERRENDVKDLTSAIERARSQVQPRIEPYVCSSTTSAPARSPCSAASSPATKA
jgi:septal ring factor EnvC (AmiA/AmiB activator)